MNSMQLILNLGYGDVITLKATTTSYDDHLLCLPYLIGEFTVFYSPPPSPGNMKSAFSKEIRADFCNA